MIKLILRAIIFSTTLFLALIIFNKVIASHLYVMPYGIRDDDAPLYSFMKLNKNYQGYSYSFSLHDGYKKIKYSTNSEGLRGEEIDYSKDLIVVSGTSSMFGLFMNDNETVQSQLQSLLNNKYTVVNAAIPQKKIPHYLITMKQFLNKQQEGKAHVKIFVNCIAEGDFETDQTLEEVLNKLNRTNLTKEQLFSIQYPIYSYISKIAKDPVNLIWPLRIMVYDFFYAGKKYTYEKGAAKGNYYINEKSKNLGYMKEMVKIAHDNNIVLINLIMPHGYKELFSGKAYSEFVEQLLVNLGAEHIVKVRDWLTNNPEVFDEISVKDDFTHYSGTAAKIIATNLNNYIQSLK